MRSRKMRYRAEPRTAGPKYETLKGLRVLEETLLVDPDFLLVQVVARGDCNKVIHKRSRTGEPLQGVSLLYTSKKCWG